MKARGSLKVSVNQTTRRDVLIREHIGLVRDAVARLGSALPEGLDAGDLAGHGIAALIEAADEYEGKAGGFAGFAKGRVWRRVTGFVREQGWYQEVVASPPGPPERHLTPGPSPQSGEGSTATASYPLTPVPRREGGARPRRRSRLCAR